MARKSEEYDIQCEFIKFMKLEYPSVLCYHVPNGGKRGVREGARFKRMGVTPGIPDLVIAKPRKGKGGLYIELKSKSRKPSPEQLKILEYLEENDYVIAVCDNLESAKTVTKAYFTD